MVEVITAFALGGIIIFIGFLGALIFERTRVPDILLLIFVGIIVGPVLHYVSPEGTIKTLAPYFASLALMIILFDGGLGLNFDKILSGMGSAILITSVTFLLSTMITAIFTMLFFGYSLALGLLIGSIIGGTSGAIVIPIISNMNVKEETRTLLMLESVITDVICIITTISIMQYITTGDADYTLALKDIASAFSIAVVIALIFGIVWLRVLKAWFGKPYSFMITIAALFVLYAGVEQLDGSGAIAALIFGVVLSNKDEFAKMFHLKTIFVFDEKIKQFQTELTFFVRTFFFVYLGILFSWTILELRFLLIGLILFCSLMIMRYVGVIVITSIKPSLQRDAGTIWTMMPRGLAAAVLASLAVTELASENLPLDVKNAATHFPDIAFLIIFLSVIVTTVGTFITERGNGRRPQGQMTLDDKV